MAAEAAILKPGSALLVSGNGEAGGAGPAAGERIEYHGVPLNTLYVDDVVNCQIYLRMGPNLYVKYREPGVAFTAEVRRKLRENRHTHIYVRSDEEGGLNRYLEANLVKVLDDSSVEPTKKAQVLYSTTTHQIRQLLERPESPDELRRAQRIVQTTTVLLLRQPEVLSNIIDVISVDYYIYTHSVNVMSYAIALAQRIGYSEGDELLELGQAALLHDIGKVRISLDIVNKSGPLTQDEFEEMKKHPGYAHDTLQSAGVLSAGVLHTVLHHHEKLNGKGYPTGLKEHDIELEVRIISCADFFDALTTRRVYRPAYRAFPALQLMKATVGQHLDIGVFKEFVKLLGAL